jgi:hypothetical protein
MSRAERDLATLTERHRQDAFLVDLLELADRGMPTSVGLLLNGMIVIGVLAPPRVFAEQVDVQRKWLVDQAERGQDSPTGEEGAALSEKFESAATSAVAERDEDREQLDRDLDEYADEDGKIDWDTVPGDLTGRLIAYGVRPVLTLRDVQVASPANPGVFRLPVLRVALSEIAGWWVITLDESGSASTPLFVTE